MTSDDTASFLRASINEPEAFTDFYRESFDGVLLFLTRRTFDVEVALDLTAETFAQGFLARHRFRGHAPEQARAWIFKIAKRQLGRYLRRGELERRAVSRLAIEVPPLDENQISAIEHLAGLADLSRALRAELGHISDEQRDAIQLRIVDELPYPAVADQLQITEQAARLRVSRGLRALASALDHHPQIKELQV